MMKSVTVAVTRLFRHTRLGKTLRETKKYMVRSYASLRCLEHEP
jgi:ribosomal protein S17